MRENASRRVANEWELRGVERCPPIDPILLVNQLSQI
jgi:hypothetical protein